MEYLKAHDSITTAEYIKISKEKIADRTARKDLAMLERMGLIEQKGQKRGAYYVLKSAE
jgi:predicted HTH transcriptional regulator